MDIETLQQYCLAKPGVTEGFPFGDNVLVFKVKGKIFLLVSLDTTPLQFNAKCDPDHAIELRETYADVQPGYHMNKRHWNTVLVNGSIPASVIRSMIDTSYRLVVQSLPKKDRAGLE